MPPTHQWATGKYLGERQIHSELSYHSPQLPAQGLPEPGESLKLEAGFYSVDLPDLPRRRAFLLVQAVVTLRVCPSQLQAESKTGASLSSMAFDNVSACVYLVTRVLLSVRPSKPAKSTSSSTVT